MPPADASTGQDADGKPRLQVDADACPVKEECYRVARRHGLRVTVVSNSRIRVPDAPDIHLQLVGDGFNMADDWIADHARDGDIVVTTDIPLAARCVAQGACVVTPHGKRLDHRNIGDALATRNLLAELREGGTLGGGPPPFGDRDRSRFLQALDAAIHAMRRRPRPQHSPRDCPGG